MAIGWRVGGAARPTKSAVSRPRISRVPLGIARKKSFGSSVASADDPPDPSFALGFAPPRPPGSGSRPGPAPPRASAADAISAAAICASSSARAARAAAAGSAWGAKRAKSPVTNDPTGTAGTGPPADGSRGTSGSARTSHTTSGSPRYPWSVTKRYSASFSLNTVAKWLLRKNTTSSRSLTDARALAKPYGVSWDAERSRKSDSRSFSVDGEGESFSVGEPAGSEDVPDGFVAVTFGDASTARRKSSSSLEFLRGDGVFSDGGDRRSSSSEPLFSEAFAEAFARGRVGAADALDELVVLRPAAASAVGRRPGPRPRRGTA